MIPMDPNLALHQYQMCVRALPDCQIPLAAHHDVIDNSLTFQVGAFPDIFDPIGQQKTS